MQRTSETFIELLEPIYSNVLNYCLALTRSEMEAKDLLQDALLKALENFDSVKDETKFKSWLFTVLTRQYYASYHKSLIRKTFLKKFHEETAEFPQVFEPEPNESNQNALRKAMSLI